MHLAATYQSIRIFFAGIWILIFVSFFTEISAQAYPSFIGFGYTTCMTCHYNPHGGGQLTDYGRALFASEIAAKPFWNLSATDDQLANTSSFLFQQPGQ